MPFSLFKMKDLSFVSLSSILFWLRTLPLTICDFEKILQSPNPDCLKFSAVEISASWADDTEVLSTAVKLFIEKATNQDWTLRVGWLNQLKKNSPQVPGKKNNSYFLLKQNKRVAVCVSVGEKHVS